MAVEYLTVEHLSTEELTRIFSRIQAHPARSFRDIPCWEIASPSDDYSRIRYRGERHRGHRLLYAWLVAPIPRGYAYGELDHLCRNTHCVNPVHLEFVDRRTNVLRGESPIAQVARKTHCLKGHPLPSERNGRNERVCKTCSRDRLSKFAERHPDRYKEIREAATRRYAERYPERRRETYRRYYKKTRT